MRDGCPFSVAGFGPCELPRQHHGPCTHGRAQAFHDGVCPSGYKCAGHSKRIAYRRCKECEVIDAREVLRIAGGGELRPLQKMPPWMHGESRVPRAKMLSWARRILREANPLGEAAAHG